MKRYALLFYFIFTTPFVCYSKEKINVIQMRAEDFVVTYLNAALSKNAFLDRKLGWGLKFYDEKKDDKVVVKAAGAYFEKNEIKQIEAATKTAKILFDGLVKRYALEGQLELKSEIKEVSAK